MASESSTTTANPLDSVRYTAGTDIGMRREENQDSFGVIRAETFRLFIVADGMGGVKGGATASGMAVNIIEQMLKDKPNLNDAGLIEGISVANRMIYEKGSNDTALSGMGTTLVALAFIDTRLIIANVGDSRAYRVRGDRIKRLTEDHTLVMELVRSGTISPEQAGNHPVSHMLTRSLGPTPEVEVDCFEATEGPRAGDRYLICSDGLYNLVTEGEMLEILNTYQLDDAIEVLIDLANQRGGTDNITTIIIGLDDTYPVEREVIDPLAALAGQINGSDAVNGEKEKPLLQDFDPFAIPDEVKEEAPEGDAAADAAEEKTAEAPKPDEQTVRTNPVISSGVSFEQVAKGAGLVEDEAAAAAQSATDTVRIEQPVIPQSGGRLSSRTLILLGILAGFLGGGFAVILINSGTARKEDPLATLEPLPGLLEPQPEEEPEIPAPKIADLSAAEIETSGPKDIELPDPGEPMGWTEHDEPLPPAAEVKPEEQPSGQPADQPVTEGLPPLIDGPPTGGSATSDHLRRRAENLKSKISDLKAKVAMFERPLAGVYGQALQSDTSKRDQLTKQLTKVQGELDTALRKLAVWYGRRTRLQDADLTSLATEVAISSADVKEKKEAFELATWEYLKEVEVLRYLPTDKMQKKKVDDLGEVRSRRMHELTDAVHTAIDTEIKNSDSEITRLTLRREEVSEQSEALKQNIDFIRTLMGNDTESKNRKRREIEKDLSVAESELKEVDQLLNKLDPQVERPAAPTAPAP